LSWAGLGGAGLAQEQAWVFLSRYTVVVPHTLTDCSATHLYRRRYYVEAEEQVWDYTPMDGDFCSGELLSWTEEQAVFTEANSLSLGSK